MSRKNLRGLLVLALSLSSSLSGLCADNANTTTSATLAEVLDIEKVIVNSIEYNPGSPGQFLSNMTKTSVTPVDPATNNMTFTPVTVKIATNRVLPIRVTASFDELKHLATSTLIPTADLSVSPTSEDIPNPYNGIITNPFTFSSLIRTTTLTGAYEGVITFTVLPIF